MNLATRVLLNINKKYLVFIFDIVGDDVGQSLLHRHAYVALADQINSLLINSNSLNSDLIT